MKNETDRRVPAPIPGPGDREGPSTFVLGASAGEKLFLADRGP